MSTQNKPTSLTLSHHVVYICSRLLAYGLPLLYFIVTTSFYLKTYDSAQIKITFTQIGTSVLLFIWLLKIIVEGRMPFRKTDMVYVAPFLAFLGFGLFACLMGPYQMWPMEEALRRFFYIILALITISEFRSEERMNRLWRWLLAAAVVSTVYGLIQFIDTRYFFRTAGIDPFIWRQAFARRVFSTFGNPNFYGNFLVIITPLVISMILKGRGSLVRPFVVVAITISMVVCVDIMQTGAFIKLDPSYSIFMSVLTALLFGGFLYLCFSKGTKAGNLSLYLIMFALIFLNLYATETKGAWLGFVGAVSVTMLLIFEYFLHTEDRLFEKKQYFIFVGVLAAAFVALFIFMVNTFVMPSIRGDIKQVGFSILAIPVFIAALLSSGYFIWLLSKPWNLKKIIYGFLLIFVIGIGGQVLNYSKTRLTSVSFRIFTWISTWEMIQTSPIIGNGIGSFKVLYPAFRRPQIIVLEGKSNTETDHSEDEYIEIWQDEGTIGFGIYLWMVLTAILCGLKQLRWYSFARPPPDKRKKKKWNEIENDPRSYEVLGILGAYAGALVHWTVDVSVRFVSSGIFSGLLPGLLVAYARNHSSPVKYEPHMPYEKWIRVGLAGICTAIILILKLELVPTSMIRNGDTGTGQIIFFCLLTGLIMYALIEFLDLGLKPEKKVPFESQYTLGTTNWKPLRLALIVVICLFLTKGLRAFVHYFQGDVHHNLAIFFSKQSIWRKEPIFESKVQRLPPDISKKYKKWGGALEHYAEVIKKNPGFPMARYFTGNVFNDWGSQFLGKAINALRQGNNEEANRLRERAMQKWDLAEEAYNGTKSLAPNYVQVHHQVGLLNLKRMQQAQSFGDQEKASFYRQAAIDEFLKYRQLDPVFMANYHRLAELMLPTGKFEEVQELYKEALYYNDDVTRQIFEHPRAYRIGELGVSLGKVYYTHATKLAKNPFDPQLPQIDEAIKYFKMANEADPKNIDAYKGLGRLLGLQGKEREAQMYLQQAYKLAPKDPELNAILRPRR